MSRETIAKRTIAERIAERLGLGQVQTLQVVQAFLDEVVDELSRGNRLEFRDFGVFETVTRKARTALNPKLEPTETRQCFACRAVVTPRQQLSPEYVPGVSCPHCAPARQQGAPDPLDASGNPA